MTVTITADGLSLLINSMEDFCCAPDRCRRRTLRGFLSLAGYANWLFNVFPLLKPCLSNLYAKRSRKDKMNAPIYINQAIVRDLKWYFRHLHNATGVHFFSSEEWSILDLNFADSSHEIAYVNASPHSLGLYFPWLSSTYWVPMLSNVPSEVIFYAEALAVCSAIHKVRELRHIG